MRRPSLLSDMVSDDWPARERILASSGILVMGRKSQELIQELEDLQPLIQAARASGIKILDSRTISELLSITAPTSVSPNPAESTITQQVAKNFLLSNEVSMKRKIKEAILAFRIERALSKERILELYLNQIYLG